MYRTLALVLVTIMASAAVARPAGTQAPAGQPNIIDPYARGDFFLTFGEQGVGLEEGYITFSSLPGGFVAKVGKMRSNFGVVNTLHNHVLPWIDRPLATENLVGGEDGIDDAGISINRILPAPKGIFLDATAQVFRGDSGDVFSHTRNSDVSAVGRLHAFRARPSQCRCARP